MWLSWIARYLLTAFSASLTLFLDRRVRLYFIALSAVVLLSVNLPLQGRELPQIPSPEEAALQAEQLVPEQLADFQIDEEMRDRLRFDPAWQPILQAVRQDIMVLKWGNNQLENPVWQRYGSKSYPLLDYYTRSSDPTRQIYGMVGIRSLGKPYSRLWLERQLKRRQNHLDFYLVTANPDLLLNPNADAPYEVDWQQGFGLDEPETRDRLLQIARDNLEPPTSPTYYEQFNLAFINAVSGDNVLPSPPPALDPANDPALGEWNQLESFEQLAPEQAQQTLTFYRNLAASTREYLLVTRLGRVKAGEISSAGRALFQQLAADAESPERMWAIAELDRHGDPQGSAMLQQALNGDLKELYSLTKWAGYGDTFYSEGIDRATHAYYLLVNIAEKYPQSQFIRAAREYGNLTGRSYFGGAPRSGIILEQIAQKTPQQRTAQWQDWLNRFPDHPGADDATYFLARSLQDQNQVVAAMELWIKMMTQSIGDGDAAYLAYPHVRTLLDVGLTTVQIENWVDQSRDSAIAPLFQYALAVRHARSHDYAKALQRSEGLDLTQMPERVLGSYYSPGFWTSYWYSVYQQPAAIQQRMQARLTEQRRRWQQLQQLQIENTPESRYQIASNWAGEGGWENGYLAVWDDSRTSLLPLGDWGDYYCKIYWSCNTELRGEEAVRDSYRQASQNAIALQRYLELLNEPQTPASLREKTLYMAASTLLWQWEDHPLGETFRIHPPPGVIAREQPPHPSEAYDRAQDGYDQIQADYQSYLDEAIAALKEQFPQSIYEDDLLFSRYAMSGQRQYLQQIVEQYPEGDRAVEAQFLLERGAF